MPNLSDIQTLLLSHASRQAGGSLHPLPDTLSDARRTTRPVAALVRAGLLEARETGDPAAIARVDGDIAYGVYLTPAGAAAIGLEADAAPQATEASPAPAPASTPARRVSKIAGVTALLSRPEGASLAELIEATGWLPHTTRAALTGLRKKGHRLDKVRAGDTTRYRIVAVAA